MVLAEAQEVDKQVADLMQETWGEEKAKEMINQQKDLQETFTKVDMLNEERVASFMRAITQLQAEGIQVESSKSTLGSLAKELESNKASSGIQNEDSKAHESMMVEKKSQIQGTLKYLVAN